MLALLLLLVLLQSGCTGMLVATLERRQIQSCVWWGGDLLTGARGVTATGGVPMATCLAVPCMTHP